MELFEQLEEQAMQAAEVEIAKGQSWLSAYWLDATVGVVAVVSLLIFLFELFAR